MHGDPKMNSQQRALLSELVGFTGASRDVGIHLLKAFNWDLELAANAFFESPPPAPATRVVSNGPDIDLDKVNTWFDTYKEEEEEDQIDSDGIIAFCNEINVDTQDIFILILSWHMKAETMCCFSREEWIQGMRKLRCDSISTFKRQMDSIRSSIDTTESFRDFYRYCFTFAREQGQKSLNLDIAIALWEIVLLPRFPLVKEWCVFLTTTQSRAISRDTWALVLDFMIQRKDKEQHYYDPNEAWPVLLDEFIEWKRSQI